MTTALEGGEESASRPGRTLPPGKTRYPLYRRLRRPRGPVWTGAENLAPPTGIRSPDRPARSQSRHQLRYPAHRQIDMPGSTTTGTLSVGTLGVLADRGATQTLHEKSETLPQ